MNVSGSFRELDFGVIPAPSGPGALLLHDEVEGDCHLVMMTHDRTTKATKAALVTIAGCGQSVFGYPNDEAYSRDPRAGDEPSCGFFELDGSTWDSELAAYNRHAFPQSPWGEPLRHFFVGLHDSSAQFLARDIEVEIVDDGFDAAVLEALRRLSIRLDGAGGAPAQD